jgi:hypothetical protein
MPALHINPAGITVRHRQWLDQPYQSKADMDHHGRDVHFVPKADIRLLNNLVSAGKE